ncbi:cation exporting V-type ATPase, subunit A [Alteracholeplasma palmae J233]|uniref:V-type ATP synthase alpha chain n=1 Tax=Alteracholeplasma palmae (strain ATCC 49389 / J233) TaxID=1318466 RepID=U4KK45_ALTPJ|nr:V-type ATP synthase subunit A [Alteracholeplasma palmae]CCV64009.1 cation exporting V-type ATPase, subunit A [Alteracholeplasma palmae J233]
MANTVYSINGPVVKIKDTKDFSMLEMVYVGKEKLMGEVISISKNLTTIQVYESTAGLKVNDEVVGTKMPVSVSLAPGILTHIFDGIERPLETIALTHGAYMSKGSDVEQLNSEKQWDITFKVKKGDEVFGGMIYATTPETSLIEHRFLIPSHIKGTVIEVLENGNHTINEVALKVELEDKTIKEVTFLQKWPIKTPRPILERLPISVPLITGQRVIDTLFPIAKGGTAALPGGFGTGKTMMQHQLAKWCDADIIVYIGCGERGNEMTQVLEEFRELIDPKTHKSLMERTVLIANTSNMPVAAREASIYTGLTIAEYYRDMGYHVAVMADSTSRWAEALREISGRLEEMPAEEGFPAYLPSRISQFYERAGLVTTLNQKEGSVSIIGAVSPQGSDFSEPVTQNTKRFVRCFWALDKQLAYERHYAAVNWNLSYSEYMLDLAPWYNEFVSPQFLEDRKQMMAILAEENKLLEIVKLIGSDVLPDDQKLIIEIGKVIRLGYLQQNAFHKEDTYVPLEKQLKMMNVILYLYKEAKKFIQSDKALSLLLKTGIFEQLVKIKYDVENNKLEKLDEYYNLIDKSIQTIR